MKYWALLVAFLYFLILVSLTWPVGYLALYKSHDFKIHDIFFSGLYWGVLGVMVLGQIALLTVPVRHAGQRPLTRGSLILPMIASGLMMACLVIGAGYSIHEFVTKGDFESRWPYRILYIGGSFWFLWTVIFYWLSRHEDPRDVVTIQCRYLLVGSILELLIAVPTHVVARSRDYCCAGAMTFIGLASGISVMLFSFGPGVFFLFVDRWKKLHPQKDQG